MTPEEQTKLNECLFDAVKVGHTQTVQRLLATGGCAGDYALCFLAAPNGHTEMVRTLLAYGVNVCIQDDHALRLAAYNGHTETVKILAWHIFAADSWRGKSHTAIEAEVDALYDKIKAENPDPERLHNAGSIILDCALTCWEQVRPAPPKLQISPFPAQPRPL